MNNSMAPVVHKLDMSACSPDKVNTKYIRALYDDYYILQYSNLGLCFNDYKNTIIKNLRSCIECKNIPEFIFLDFLENEILNINNYTRINDIQGNPNIFKFKLLYKSYLRINLEGIKLIFSKDENFGDGGNSNETNPVYKSSLLKNIEQVCKEYNIVLIFLCSLIGFMSSVDVVGFMSSVDVSDLISNIISISKLNHTL